MQIRSLVAATVCAAMLSACSASNMADITDEAEKTVYAMDTVMTLKAYGENAEKALEDAEREIVKLDSALGRGNTDSEIYKVNAEKSAEVSEETAGLVRDALDICSSTDGAFDISIAPVMDLWGFYTKDFYVPSADELAQELTRVNYKNISADKNVISVSGNSQIDLGGIAKGYLSDRIMDILRSDGVESGIISLGGNVKTLGKKPDGSDWRVAIQDPDDEEEYMGILSVSDMAVITSGNYQRFFERDGVMYHHIIDPSDGYPADTGLASVTIVSDDGTLADGLSTALYVMGLEKGMEYWKNHDGFDVMFVTEDKEILITKGIEAIFESPYEYSVIE